MRSQSEEAGSDGMDLGLRLRAEEAEVVRAIPLLSVPSWDPPPPESSDQPCSTQQKEAHTWERDPKCFQGSRQDGGVGDGAGGVSGALLWALVLGGGV